MDREEFTPSKTGRLVPIPARSADVAFAFVPDGLPPRWALPHEQYTLLIEARSALASLNGVGRHLPNPEIVLQPLQQREAKLSSQLEGTFTDPQRQALFQADPRYPTSLGDPTNAYREVYNYGRALRLRFDGNAASNSLPLSKRLIRELHAILMEGVRSYQQQPGEFRTIQNQIGHPARFVPPPPQLVEPLLDDFEQYLNSDDQQYDPLVRAFLAHYQFEAIHPFIDGNGRVGRLLLALTIAEWCKLSNQWLYMSAFFERNKKQYMDLLLRVSTHGAWDDWMRFCLEGVVAQAEDTEKRCDKLLRLHREFHQRLKGGSVRLSSIVDNLFVSPVVTVVGIKEALNVTFPTARADLKKLEGLGILKPLEGFPQLAYYCDPIYKITYDDIDVNE